MKIMQKSSKSKKTNS